jgi:glycosyltransferase involved in cell wall biosynthesis
VKKVSVIIPNYNNAQYVAGAIQSVLAQSFADYDIIVVDDGSTDNSRQVVHSFGDKVRHIYQQNKGLGGARNAAILASEAEFIGLLDADDEWSPNFLEKMVALTSLFPSGAAYFCGAQGIDTQGNSLPQYFGGAPKSNSTLRRGNLYARLLRLNYLIPSTFLVRRSIFEEVGLFEQNNRKMHGCEDWDLWLRMARTHDFVGTPSRLVRYRIHTNALSANPGKMQDAARAVIEAHFGPEEDNVLNWSPEKRRAYGGLYRYDLLTSVQRQQDWQNAANYFRKALEIDPSLSKDIDMFYELALGYQPSGYRGTRQHLNLQNSIAELEKLLYEVFSKSPPSWQASVRRTAYGMANFAIGLAAYNTGQRRVSRGYLMKALFFYPGLWFDPRVSANLIKSFVSQTWIQKLQNLAYDRKHRESIERF